MNGEMEPEMAILASGLTRFYGIKRGVQNFNFTAKTGSIIGLLGENGCGKTTALKLVMGALTPNTGRITTLGVNPASMPPATRARIGWLSDQLAVPDRFTLKESMTLQREYFPTWNQALAFDLAGEFGLTETSIFGQLSLGQKRRFMLLLVIAQMPDLLVLDEPASGLDTAVRRQLIDILIDHAASRSMTIVLSSHILSDVERLVDHVAFMKNGAVLIQDDLDGMRGRVKRLCISDGTGDVALRERFHVIQTDEVGGIRRVVVDDFDAEKLQGIPATVEHLNLEELFLVYNELAGHEVAL